MDYHASAESLIGLGEKSNADMVAFYHLVPVPPNSVVTDAFMRGAPDNFLLAEDLMWFELPFESDDKVVCGNQILLADFSEKDVNASYPPRNQKRISSCP